MTASPGARLRVTALVFAAVFAGLVAGAGRAAAQSCPAPTGTAPSLAAVDGGARLAWIDARLSRTAHHTRLWRGWITAGLAAATVANLIPVAFVAPDSRVDWYTGSVTTIAGIVPLYIQPLPVLDDAAALRVEVQTLGPAGAAAGTPEVCRVLADAEVRLARSAAAQANSQRWWWHAGNFALNAGVGLFLGIGFHHWLAGAFNFVSGAVIGEAIILTQPTGNVDDLEHYRLGDLAAPPRAASFRVGARF